MQELLKIIAQGLVEKPEEVSVTLDEPKEDGSVVYHLHVAEEDMGRVIAGPHCESDSRCYACRSNTQQRKGRC